jgi:hypothetical protein
VYKSFKANDWVLKRVRASTHRILTKAERKNASLSVSNAFCIGTIRQYCPQVNEYLVVFDEDQMQPKWVQALKGTMEVTISEFDSQLSLSSGQESTAVHGTRGGDMTSVCELCERSCEKSADNVLVCSQCHLSVHDYCIPNKSEFKLLNDGTPSLKKTLNWKCWKCCGELTFFDCLSCFSYNWCLFFSLPWL